MHGWLQWFCWLTLEFCSHATSCTMLKLVQLLMGSWASSPALLMSSWASSHVCAGVDHLLMVPDIIIKSRYSCTTCPKSPSYLVDPATLAAKPIQSPAGICDRACLTSCGGIPYFISASRGRVPASVQTYNLERDHWLLQATSGSLGVGDRHFTAIAGMDQRSCIVGFKVDSRPWLFDTRSRGWSGIAADSALGGSRALSVAPIGADQLFLLTEAGCRILDLRNNKLQAVEIAADGTGTPGRVAEYGLVATLGGNVLLMGAGLNPELYDPASGAWQQLLCGSIGPHVPRSGYDLSSLSAVVSLPAL